MIKFTVKMTGSRVAKRMTVNSTETLKWEFDCECCYGQTTAYFMVKNVDPIQFLKDKCLFLHCKKNP